ncbi:hypothetical protein [Acidiphilium sp.]|uniref:hypothetical protein n=1 Tax=Acidiphilium sp. TaxID=527 RepID=UPI003CFF8A5F
MRLTNLALRWIGVVNSNAVGPQSVTLSDLKWLDRACAVDRARAHEPRGSHTNHHAAGATSMLDDALATLGQRERHIVIARRLLDEPVARATLAMLHRMTVDQVRQTEAAAFAAVQRWMVGYVVNRRAIYRASVA